MREFTKKHFALSTLLIALFCTLLAIPAYGQQTPDQSKSTGSSSTDKDKPGKGSSGTYSTTPGSTTGADQEKDKPQGTMPTTGSTKMGTGAKPASDRDITREVRKAVVQDKTLSMAAHKVKVNTKEGKVTLKGDVASEDEKTKVADIAKSVPGVTEVINDLSVKSADTEKGMRSPTGAKDIGKESPSKEKDKDKDKDLDKGSSSRPKD